MNEPILTGTVTLRNTKQYPFNDSTQTVALQKSLRDTDYTVVTELLTADGYAGDITVSDKAVNGFKLAFTGSARAAAVRYRILGGNAV